MTTKVLLVYPDPSYTSPQKSPPLSILHVGEALKQAKACGKSDENYEVRYFDERYDDPPDFSWPDVVGVSSMTGIQLKGAIKFLKEAKRFGKRTILGGIHVTMQPDQCLNEDFVDSIVLSEGEWAVIEAIHGEHKGIYSHHLNGEHVSPVSAETLVHFRRSAAHGDTVLLSSRGCPFRCGFCLDGDTPVLMSDLTWKPIRDIVIGEEVFGLQKVSYGHDTARAKVFATSKRQAETYEIVTTEGTVIATGEHPWLSHSDHSRWRRTDNLRAGDKIRFLTPPVKNRDETDDYKYGYLAGASVGDGYFGEYDYPGMQRQHHFGLVGDDEMLDTFKGYSSDLSIDVIDGKFNGGKTYPGVTRKIRTNSMPKVAMLENIAMRDDGSIEYQRGFLAGFFDADGSCDANTIRFWQKDEAVSMRVARYLSTFGFRVSLLFRRGEHDGLTLLGGVAEKLRFIATVRPRVSHKAPVFGYGMGNAFAVVLSVKPAGVRDVYDIQTETENFIANGLVSHNCYIQKFFQRNWQSVDLDRWKHDILYLRDNAGVTKLEHGDDWIGKWSRAKEIIRFLWDNGIEYRPSIRAHQINDDVAREMAEMGIKHLSIGMETASPRILDLVQKDITPQDQIVCAESLSKYGIWPLYYWIVGFPTETQAELNETLDQVDRVHAIHNGKLTQNIYAYVALPGSNMFDLVDTSKLPKTMEEWSNYSLNQTYDQQASNLYHIGGLNFHRGRGDKTDRNFPGARRLLIAPFELSAGLRWKYRYFKHFGLEKRAIEALLEDAHMRSSKRIWV